MTAREFAVFAHLCAIGGRSCPKRDILAGVWDDDFEGDPNIVEVYIGHLRQKLDRPFGRSASRRCAARDTAWCPMVKAILTGRSVRGRATLAAGAVVAVALFLGALLFDTALTRGVEESAIASAEASAERIAARLGPDGSGKLGTDFDDDELVQVLTQDDAIVGASPDARDIPPLREGRVVHDNDVFVVAQEGVKDSRLKVMVAHEIDDGLEVVAAARWLLATTIPILIGFVALGAWILTGRALAPVTRIRAEVEDIETAGLDKRLRVPDTGDDTAQLASTMNHMLDRLDASARAQRRFVADASHELRSPLAAIHQHAEVASASPREHVGGRTC